jgi:hypothetical protein
VLPKYLERQIGRFSALNARVPYLARGREGSY